MIFLPNNNRIAKQWVFLLIVFALVDSFQIIDVNKDLNSRKIKENNENNYLNLVNFDQYVGTSDDFTGNLTQTELSAVKKYISQSQNSYELGQLNQMARYISNGLQGLSPIRYWNVFVYDNQTKGAGYQGNQILNKYLWWIKYGKYQLTYVLCVVQECYGTGTAGALAEFGEDVSSSDQDFIKQTVKNSQLYNGEDCQQGAKYIKKKIQQNKKSFIFNVYVTKPSTKYGFYECKRRQYWAQLSNFGTLGFNYYLVRVF